METAAKRDGKRPSMQAANFPLLVVRDCSLFDRPRVLAHHIRPYRLCHMLRALIVRRVPSPPSHALPPTVQREDPTSSLAPLRPYSVRSSVLALRVSGITPTHGRPIQRPLPPHPTSAHAARAAAKHRRAFVARLGGWRWGDLLDVIVIIIVVIVVIPRVRAHRRLRTLGAAGRRRRRR